MQAIKRRGVGLVLAVLLLGGLVGPSAPAIATPTPMPTVQVWWSWWIMGGGAKFTPEETQTMAEMSVVGAVGYAIEKIPNHWGKAAAAALGVAIWATARNALPQGKCVMVVFSVLKQSVYPTKC